MEVNLQTVTKETLVEVTRELAKNNPNLRKMTLGLAGIDSTDGVTSMNYEERCAALEGLCEFFIEERKRTIKYVTLAVEVFKEGYMHNTGKHLLKTMEKDYE